MNTETIEQPESAVAVLPPAARAAVALRAAEHEIRLHSLLLNSARIVAPTNKAGRDECHSAYMVLKNARCSIANLADGATDDAKAFTKAVKAEALRLIAITEAEESRLQGLRDAYDVAEKARKDALIAAERARMDRIQAEIQEIRDIPAGLVLKSSSEIAEAIDALRAQDATADRFAEFLPLAQSAIDAADHALTQMHGAKAQAEQVARDAEVARLAAIERQRIESARIAAEREELARLRAEAAEASRLAKIDADRITAEQKAEAKRLYDAIARQRAEQAERERVADEAQKEAQRALEERAKNAADELLRQQAEIAAERKALAAQQAAAHARDQQAIIECLMPEAHAMNVMFDADRLDRDYIDAAEINRHLDDLAALQVDCDALQSGAPIIATPAPADHAIEVIAITRASLPDLADQLIDAELWPEDAEIVAEIRHMFMAQWGMDEAQADARMGRFDFAAAVAGMAD